MLLLFLSVQVSLVVMAGYKAGEVAQGDWGGCCVLWRIEEEEEERVTEWEIEKSEDREREREKRKSSG
jgi:hypothetical protein